MLVAVAAIVVIVLVWSSDESEPDGIAFRAGHEASPGTDARRSGQQSGGTRTALQDEGFFGAAGSAGDMTNGLQSSGSFRFRPLGGISDNGPLRPSIPPGSKQPYDGLEFGRQGVAGYGAPTGQGSMGYQFRPLGEEEGTPKRYEPYVVRPGPDRAYSYGAPERLQESPGMKGIVDLPDASAYRFRPRNEESQSKRWRGNYRRMSTSPAQLASPDGGSHDNRNPT